MINNQNIVSNIINNMEDSVMSIAELKKKLKGKINNKSLILILKNLEEAGKIFIGSKGITWIHSSPKHLKAMLKNSLEI